MIKANFNTYNTYVTDSLYQWDVNQDLVINGLNLSVAPEIHFANANMDKAIVRQSTLESGVVTVRIPNSLLQAALTIKAYVGIYEGDTFKVIETIEIPVIAKAKPADYTIENDEEIYSFKALANEIVKVKAETAEMCEANKIEIAATAVKTVEAVNEVETRVLNTIDTLNNRVDTIIANNNDTEGNSELVDIRTGANGIIYNSAGEAVREQFTEINDAVFNSDFNNAVAFVKNKNKYYPHTQPGLKYEEELFDIADATSNIYPCRKGEIFKITSVASNQAFALCRPLTEDLVSVADDLTVYPDTYSYDPQTNIVRIDHDYPYVLIQSRYNLTVLKKTNTSKIPGKTSDLENDSGFCTQADIEGMVSNILYRKKWVPCGDSFTHGADVGTIQGGIYDGCKRIYPYLIGNRNNMTIVNTFFMGGRTLAYPADGTFTNSITCPTAECYYQNIPEDTDYITIYLGINDSHHSSGTSGNDGEDVTGVIPIGTINDADTSTYYGAWNVVLSWLREHRPFTHIGIIVSNGCDTNEYRVAQLEIAKKFGVPYIDLNGDSRTPAMIRSNNTDIANSVKTIINKSQAVDYDGTKTGNINLHPNDYAHEFESTFIENFLRSI